MTAAAPAAAASRPHAALTVWTLLVVLGMVVLPLGALVVHALADGPGAALAAALRPETAAALRLTLGLAVVTTACNSIVGLTVAWALVRWQFAGKALLNALVDLPLSVPTLVAGFLIVALYGPSGALGPALHAVGIEVVYARPALLLALLFITFPFVVRAVEPVLAELDPTEEAAAWTLGASRLQTLRFVLLPAVLPAVAAGAVQVFARAVAEFGAVAVVSGNIPFETLTATVAIQGDVEAGDTVGAAAASLVLLAVALLLQPLSRALAARAVQR